MTTKIVSLDELRTRAEELRASGKKLVATNGCFDLLHAGHVRYLQAARALGDALVVGVNGDDAARQLKGPGRPLNPERDRAEVLAALACVDWVTIFHDTRAVRFLESAAPAVYVKGGDYTIENTVVLSITEHYGVYGSYHEQLRGVPDGRKVAIKVEKPADSR